MSQLRANSIKSINNSQINISGITTFTGTGAIQPPGGDSTLRPTEPKVGQIRRLTEAGTSLEYYNGTTWVEI